MREINRQYFPAELNLLYVRDIIESLIKTKLYMVKQTKEFLK